MEELDQKISAHREELTSVNDITKDLEKSLKEITQSLTNDQLVAHISKIQSENESLDKKVQAFKSGGITLISEDDVNKALDEKSFYFKNWKKYKKGCKEIVDIISESSE